MIDSARALSYEEPTAPVEGLIPAVSSFHLRLECGVRSFQPLQLRRLLRGGPRALAAINLSLTAPLADRLRRPDTEQCRDLGHRGPVGLVVGPQLGDHPDRPLTQFGRVPLRRTP